MAVSSQVVVRDSGGSRLRRSRNPQLCQRKREEHTGKTHLNTPWHFYLSHLSLKKCNSSSVLEWFECPSPNGRPIGHGWYREVTRDGNVESRKEWRENAKERETDTTILNPFSTICFAFYIGRDRVNMCEVGWSESSLQNLVGMSTFRSFPGRVKIRLANWFDEGGLQLWRFTHMKHNVGARQPVELLLNLSTESDNYI